MNRLPPLNPLRAFEAAARLGSFQKAADELNVTPPAISHQVRVLEDYLGVTLFHRESRRIRPTEQGEAYLGAVSEGLERIAEATSLLLKATMERPLTVSSAPSFASGWLVPRLVEFHTQHPDVEVRLDTSVQLVDLQHSDIDVAIRYTANPVFEGLAYHCLEREELVPVCSPSLLQGETPLHEPDDLKRFRLLHTRQDLGQWRGWLAAAGVDHPEPEAGPKFDNYSLTLEAAASGLGVAIAIRPAADSHLRSGRLAMPFDVAHITEAAYYLVYPQASADDHRVRIFREWLLGTLEGDTGC